MQRIAKNLLILIIFSMLVTANLFSETFDHSYKELQKVYDCALSMDQSQSLVDYKHLKLEPEALNNQLKQMEELSEADYDKFQANQKKAFLINAYNAFTIKLILDNYPTQSIKKLGSLLESPWEKEFINLFGKKRHLNYIEHERLRADFPDARIHFAVVCASIGCPSLSNKVFLEEDIENQLETASIHFTNNQSKNCLLYTSPSPRDRG